MKLFLLLTFSVAAFSTPTKDYLEILSCIKSIHVSGIKSPALTRDGSFLLNGSAPPNLGTLATSTTSGKTYIIRFDSENGYYNESNSCLTRYYFRNSVVENKRLGLCVGVGQKIAPNQKRSKPKISSYKGTDKQVANRLMAISENCVPEGGDKSKEKSLNEPLDNTTFDCDEQPEANCCLGSKDTTNFKNLPEARETTSADLLPHFKNAISSVIDAFEKELPKLSEYVENKAKDAKAKERFLTQLNSCHSKISNESVKTYLTANIEYVKKLNFTTSSGRSKLELGKSLQIDNLPATSIASDESPAAPGAKTHKSLFKEKIK